MVPSSLKAAAKTCNSKLLSSKKVAPNGQRYPSRFREERKYSRLGGDELLSRGRANRSRAVSRCLPGGSRLGAGASRDGVDHRRHHYSCSTGSGWRDCRSTEIKKTDS